MSWSEVVEEGGPLNAEEEGQLFGTMSWSTRIQGFALFMVLGLIANVLSWIALSHGSISKYAGLMTMSNLMSLFSTGFLMGPKRQYESMFDPTRRCASTTFLTSMAATFVAAFSLHSIILCAVCSVVQCAALVWYCLSYVPYGRQMARNCVGGCARLMLSV